MTNDAVLRVRPASASIITALLSLTVLGVFALPIRAADGSYPFEGTWVRANRACTATAPLARTYTAREVAGATLHCSVRKIASGSGQFEIFEDCRRGERPGNFTETIRMLGLDAMVVRRQTARLKIARPLRYIRCTLAAPAAPKPSAPRRPAASGEALPRAMEEQPGPPKTAEPPNP